MASGKFLFNNSIQVSGGLTAPTFTRSVTTLDPQGNAVASGVPRFDAETLLTGAQDTGDFLADFGPPPDVGSNFRIWDSGYDKTGVDWWLIAWAYDPGPNKLIVFKRGTSTPFPATVYTLTSFTHTTSGSKQVSGFAIVNGRRYIPHSASICHGFIAVGCAACVETTPGTYSIEGTAVVYSTDGGTTWQLLFEDVSAGQQPGLTRGREWSLPPYFVPYPGTGNLVLEAWFVVADYRHKAQNPACQDGRFYVFRITRTYNGGQFSDWVVEPAKTLMFDVAGPTLGDNADHAHAGAIVKSGTTGVRLVAGIGDTAIHNRLFTATLADHSDPGWWNPSHWTVTDNYHGRAVPTTSPPPNDRGADDNQITAFLGSQEVDPAATVCGADTTAEPLVLLRTPSETSRKPTMEHLWGIDSDTYSTSGANSSPMRGAFNALGVRCPAPERRETIVAHVREEFPGEFADHQAQRILYHPPSQNNLRLWAEVAARRTVEPTAAAFGDTIAMAGQLGGSSTGDGIRRVLRPGTGGVGERTLRPIVISPGGINMLRAGFAYTTFPANPHLIQPLTRNPTTGRWEDTSVSPAIVLPAAACRGDRAFRVRVENAASGAVDIARMYIASATAGNDNETGWAKDPQARKFRVLACDGSHHAHSGFSRPSTGRFSCAYSPTDALTDLKRSQGNVSVSDRWIPHTLSVTEELAANQSPRIVLRSGFAPTDSSEGHYYIIFDTARDGEMAFPYPLDPHPGPDGPDPNGPDELLDITGLALNGAFTLLLAGMMPGDDWDQRTPRTGGLWPLFTLVAGSGHHLEFDADTTTSRFALRGQGSGGTFDHRWGEHLPDPPQAQVPFKQHWGRNSPLLIGISYTGSSLIAVASLGGGAPIETASLTLTLSPPVSLLKFRGFLNEVVSFRWFGGEVKETAETEQQIRDHLESLDFLIP